MTSQSILDAIVLKLQEEFETTELFIERMPENYLDNSYTWNHNVGAALPHLVQETVGQSDSQKQLLNLLIGITLHTHFREGDKGAWAISDKIRRILSIYQPVNYDSEGKAIVDSEPLMPIENLMYDGFQLVDYHNNKWTSLMKFSLNTIYILGT
jgi:hypothetical protein